MGQSTAEGEEMKNLIIIIGTILLGAVIVNTMVLGAGDNSLKTAASKVVGQGIASVNSLTIDTTK